MGFAHRVHGYLGFRVWGYGFGMQVTYTFKFKGFGVYSFEGLRTSGVQGFGRASSCKPGHPESFEVRNLGSRIDQSSTVVPIYSLRFSHRPLSSSFWGLPYRILNINPKRNYLGAYG